MSGRRVVLVDHIAERAALLASALEQQGHRVVATLQSSAEILARIDLLAPDIILADMQAPDRDTIEDVRFVMQRRPCPIVMYAGSADSDAIQTAIDAGVSAYVTGDIDAGELTHVLNIASVRFAQFRSMAGELAKSKAAVDGRRVVERAKALLMAHHGIDEGAAHKTLQKLAMNQRISLAQAARSVAMILKTQPELTGPGDTSAQHAEE